MIVYNNQQQSTRLCSFQEDFVVLQSPLRNYGNQGQLAIVLFYNSYLNLKETKKWFFSQNVLK